MDYAAAITALKESPLSVLRGDHLEQLISLALTIPERIKSLQSMRRELHDRFETALEELEAAAAIIELKIKNERDDVTGKPLFSSETARKAESLLRREKDGAYASKLRSKKKLWTLIKEHDEEIQYLESIDRSLSEVLGLITATLGYEARHDKYDHPNTTERARERSKLSLGARA